MHVPLWAKVQQRYFSCRTYVLCSAYQTHLFPLSALCWFAEWQGGRQASPQNCQRLLRPWGFPSPAASSAVGQFWLGPSSVLRFLPVSPFYNLPVCPTGTHSAGLRISQPGLCPGLTHWPVGCTCTRNDLFHFTTPLTSMRGYPLINFMTPYQKERERDCYLWSLINHPGIETATCPEIISLERHWKWLEHHTKHTNTVKVIKDPVTNTDDTWRISLKNRGTGGW